MSSSTTAEGDPKPEDHPPPYISNSSPPFYTLRDTTPTYPPSALHNSTPASHIFSTDHECALARGNLGRIFPCSHETAENLQAEGNHSEMTHPTASATPSRYYHSDTQWMPLRSPTPGPALGQTAVETTRSRRARGQQRGRSSCKGFCKSAFIGCVLALLAVGSLALVILIVQDTQEVESV